MPPPCVPHLRLTARGLVGPFLFGLSIETWVVSPLQAVQFTSSNRQPRFVCFHFSPPTANRSIAERDIRTRRPILWTGSFFESISLSRVRSEISRRCAVLRLLSNICSGIGVSLPRCAVNTQSQTLPTVRKDNGIYFSETLSSKPRQATFRAGEKRNIGKR